MEVSRDGSLVQCTLAPESMTQLRRLDLLVRTPRCAMDMHLLHEGVLSVRRIMRVLRHNISELG